MNKTKIIKVVGIVGAILTGAATVMSGHVTEGVGIIAAAFGSANLGS